MLKINAKSSLFSACWELDISRRRVCFETCKGDQIDAAPRKLVPGPCSHASRFSIAKNELIKMLSAFAHVRCKHIKKSLSNLQFDNNNNVKYKMKVNQKIYDIKTSSADFFMRESRPCLVACKAAELNSRDSDTFLKFIDSRRIEFCTFRGGS